MNTVKCLKLLSFLDVACTNSLLEIKVGLEVNFTEIYDVKIDISSLYKNYLKYFIYD